MIYATLVSWPGKYNSARWTPPAAAVLVLLVVVALGAQSSSRWREAPELTRLFAPAGPRAAAYRMYVSAADLDAALRDLAAEETLVRTPGAWEPQSVAPLDAFGQAGTYDRSKVTRLYGSRQVRVARGARLEHDRIAEAWTLLSPYPDPRLERLEGGTLLMVLRFPESR